MTEETWFQVPEEISDLFLDAKVSDECRDKCIETIFRAKRAIYYGRLAIKARDKAWKLVCELYPDLDGKFLTYDYKKCAVKVGDAT